LKLTARYHEKRRAVFMCLAQKQIIVSMHIIRKAKYKIEASI